MTHLYDYLYNILFTKSTILFAPKTIQQFHPRVPTMETRFYHIKRNIFLDPLGQHSTLHFRDIFYSNSSATCLRQMTDDVNPIPTSFSFTHVIGSFSDSPLLRFRQLFFPLFINFGGGFLHCFLYLLSLKITT